MDILNEVAVRDAATVAKGMSTILADVLKKSAIGFHDKLNLNSIQILKALALVETTFQVEVEDEVVFHGLFSSVCNATNYVCQVLDIPVPGTL